MKNVNYRKSLIMLASAMFIFGTIGIFRRYISVSSSMLAFLRGVIGTLYILVFSAVSGKGKEKIGKKCFLKLAVTGALIGLNWMFLFEAYRYTSVAAATLSYYMQPTIVILLSPIVFKEKLTWKKVICVFAAIAGMVLISGVLEGEKASSENLKGIIYGLSAAALYSTVVIINKKISGVDAYKKTMIQLSFAAIIMIPYLFVTDGFSVSFNGSAELLMVLLVGLVHTGIAYVLYFGSMDGLPAQTVALGSYIDPVTALILSAVILKEPLSFIGVIGAVLILGAAFVSER